MKLLLLILACTAVEVDRLQWDEIPSFTAWRATQQHINRYRYCHISITDNSKCHKVVQMVCHGYTSRYPEFVSIATQRGCTDRAWVELTADSYTDVRGVSHDYSYEFIKEVYDAWLFFFRPEDLVPLEERGFAAVAKHKAEMCALAIPFSKAREILDCPPYFTYADVCGFISRNTIPLSLLVVASAGVAMYYFSIEDAPHARRRLLNPFAKRTSSQVTHSVIQRLAQGIVVMCGVQEKPRLQSRNKAALHVHGELTTFESVQQTPKL